MSEGTESSVRVLERSSRSTVFHLALPVLTEQLLSYTVSLVDTWLAGRLGENATVATGAVGLAGYVSWLGTLLFGLVGIGTTAIVARAWGANRRSQANRIANQAISLAVVLGVAFLCMMLPAAPAFAAMLRMEGEAADIAVRYLRIDAVGLVFTAVTLAASAGLRGAGDMRTPMFVLAAVNVVNAFCSIALTFGIGPIAPLGVDGIVVGTLIARCVGAVLMLLIVARGVSGLQLERRLLRPKLPVARRILDVGGPAAVDGLVMWIGHFLFLMVISNLAEGPAGATVFAAHIVGIRLEAVTYLPAVAWGAAAATLVGQSLGARRPDRAAEVGHEAVRQCFVVGGVMTAALFFAAGPLYALMHGDAAVRVAGVPALRLLACFQMPLVLSIVYVHALRGAGDTRWPMLITIAGVIGIRLPVSYLCGIVLDGGLVGAWIGMCADIFVRAVLATARFSHGGWKSTRV